MSRKNAQMVSGIILSVVIAGIFLGYVLPIGIDAYANATNTSTNNWSSAENSIFGILGIFLVLVPLIALASVAMKSF